jgi:hypothetical protein
MVVGLIWAVFLRASSVLTVCLFWRESLVCEDVIWRCRGLCSVVVFLLNGVFGGYNRLNMRSLVNLAPLQCDGKRSAVAVNNSDQKKTIQLVLRDSKTTNKPLSIQNINEQ